MEIVNIKVSSLRPYEKNAKKHSQTQIDNVAKSIEKYGFVQPLVIDKNNVVIIGHCRLEASKKLKLDKVPCVLADTLTDEQVKELRLLDNKLNESEWDLDLISEELADLDLSDFELDWGIEELEPEKEVEEDNFDVDANISEEPKAKLGDIYQLGESRLMCGDSTKEEDVAKLMDGAKADMVFTDPPYGMNLDTDFSGMKNKLDFAKEKGFTGGKKYEQGIVDEFNPKMIDLIMGLNVKETFLWGADYFAELLPNKNDGSWIVWDKRANNNDDIEQDYSSDKMYGSCFELCWSKNKHKRDIARVKWAGVFGTEQEFDHKRYHPTQKPIKLCEWFIKRYSQDKATILDLFGGSGSTLIACEQLDRKCYMMELDPHYIDVIIKRYEDFTGKKAVKIN